MIDFVEKSNRCKFCGRTATKQCDMPKARTYTVGHPPRTEMEKAHKTDVAFHKVEWVHTITCDNMLCDDCAITIHSNIDICPSCANAIKIKRG